MELLVITNLFPNKQEPNRGIFNYQQISCLAKKCSLTVVAPISWIDAIQWRKHGDLAITREYSVAHPVYFYTPKVLRFMYGYFYYFSIFKKVHTLISKSRPTVILSTWAYPDSFASCLIAKPYKVPVVIKVHGTDIHSVQGYFRRRLTSWALKSCEEIISVSVALKRIMVEDFGIAEDKIYVVPNGVDKNKFYPMTSGVADKLNVNNINSQKNSIFIGNLKEEKNVRLLVNTFVDVVNIYGDQNILHIIGSGALYDELLSIIDKHNMQKNIILHGAIDHSLIPIWMNFADLLILPSDNEGMPNVVLEAKACGTPVLLSDIDAHRELVDEGKNGYLFDLNDSKDLAVKIDKILKNDLSAAAIVSANSVITWQDSADLLMSRIKI